MMNSVIIYHSKTSVFLVLWFSLVALCDPHPSSGGSHHYARGVGIDAARKRDPEHVQHKYADTFIDHSRTAFNYDGKYSPTISASPFQSAFPRLSPISKMSANNSNLSTSTWLVPSPTQLSSLKSPNIPSGSVGNVSSSNSFSSVDDRNKKKINLEKGQPSTLDSSELDSESLKKSRLHPKLNLKLDRDYAPSEIAEYIWRTGDEKGFAQTVGEMFQDGELLESKEHVIRFLEKVQRTLHKMRVLKKKGSHQTGHAL